MHRWYIYWCGPSRTKHLRHDDLVLGFESSSGSKTVECIFTKKKNDSKLPRSPSSVGRAEKSSRHDKNKGTCSSGGRGAVPTIELFLE